MGLGAATSLNLLQLLIFNNFGVRLHFKAYCLSLECNAVAVEHIRQQSLPQASVPMGREGKPRAAGSRPPVAGVGSLPSLLLCRARGARRAAPAHAGTAGLGATSREDTQGLCHPAAEGCWPRSAPSGPPGPARTRLSGRSRCGSATSRRPPRPYSCVWERRLEAKLLTRFIWLFPWLGI